MKQLHLTRCELEVMQVVWDRECVTVQDVVDALNRSLAYTTVLTTMRILGEKQFVEQVGKQGRAYLYRPRISRDEVQQSMMKALKDSLFRGSLKSMVLSVLGNEDLSHKDILELRRAIESVEEEIE